MSKTIKKLKRRPRNATEYAQHQALRLVREQQESIKLHTIHVLLGAPPLPRRLTQQPAPRKEVSE